MTSPTRVAWPAARAALVSVCACGVLISCGGGGGRIQRPSAAPAENAGDPATRSPLEGDWTLVALETAGGRRAVSGFLRYDRFANITVKAELAPDDPAARPPRTVVADFTAKAAAGPTELAFTGLRQGTGPERLTDDAVNMAEWRHYEVSGDTLRLSVRDHAATLVFQRAP